MSSLRNAVARRPHKERSQPESRAKWGILEKHKDYSLRAKDYNQKKAKLKILTQKSSQRHPDEFAFGMLSAESGKAGKHGTRGNENRLSHDAVQLLKTQDAGYLRTVGGRTRREIQRLSDQVDLDKAMKKVKRRTDDPESIGSKVVFDDSEDEREPSRENANATEVFDGMNGIEVTGTLVETEERAEGHGKLSDEGAPELAKARKSQKQIAKEVDSLTKLKQDRKRRKRLQEMRTTKLAMLKKRQREILAATDELELQRSKMAKTVGGANKNGVKFKIRERKR